MSKEIWKTLGRKGYLERNIEILEFCLRPQVKTEIIHHLGDTDLLVTETLNSLVSKGYLVCNKSNENTNYRVRYHTTRGGMLLLAKWKQLMEAFK
jgi:predicted transcriptional regulator